MGWGMRAGSVGRAVGRAIGGTVRGGLVKS